MHFGAITCEGCKGFFRRSVKKNASFSCAFEKKCEINKNNRKHCQACRFNACLAAGMNSSLILSDEEVNKKRDLIRMNREKSGSKQPQATRMTMDEKLLVKTLLKGHRDSYDFAYVEYDTFRGREPGSNDGQQEIGNNTENPNGLDAATAVEAQSTTEDSGKQLHLMLLFQHFLPIYPFSFDPKAKQLFQHFCDIMTWGIRKVIDYCKGIPQFVQLSIVDQIVLLRGGCLEMLVLRSYFAFSCNENKYMSDKFQYKPSDFLQAGGNKEFVEKYNSLHIRMRKMKLQVEEICLLLALVLFSPDRPGLEDQAKVEQMQDCVANTLQAYEYTHKPPNESSFLQARTMYCELLLILPILRTINMLFAQNIMSLKQTNEKDMNPLILEVNNSADDED
uniref:Nuclear receptor n=1 Tax=Ciona intestinalis TaxID=7719 RepID=Q1RL97_CIOIN|nr:nuclear receptor VDR-b [Ciona intestinalis]FAA00168.1 TPA: nuclear receptor [Ciona intestinalis]|eukprot:NP_001037831.1 nuclear receptor VDR-b [Ciona intestinalis]